MSSDQPPPNSPADSSSKSINNNSQRVDSSNEVSQNALDLNKPCRIKGVSFEGSKRTRPSILARIVADIFPSETLWDCLQRAVQIRENLKNLNAFSEIDMQIQRVDETNDTDFTITFLVTEKGRIRFSAQTAADTHSTHLNLELVAPNVNGIGDSIQLTSKFNKRFYSGECSYKIPFKPWKQLFNPIYSLAYSQYQYDSQPSGIDQEDKSIINKVDFLSHPQVQHSISFENVWRYIKSSYQATPRQIREQCGHSVKSSLRHSVTWDCRVGGNYPYEGILAGISNEFTTNLVQNSARFTRHEANLQLNTLVIPEIDLLCQVNLLAGSLIKPQRINICDRFFVGGPLNLRGFKLHGVGPSVRDHPLGGLSYLSAGIHLYSILPYTNPETTINQFIRPHVFLNSGTIGDIRELRNTTRQNFKTELIRFRDSFRHSCGFGLVMYLMSLRLEVNYCFPLVYRNGDLITRGLQWGFGLHYT